MAFSCILLMLLVNKLLYSLNGLAAASAKKLLHIWRITNKVVVYYCPFVHQNITEIIQKYTAGIHKVIRKYTDGIQVKYTFRSLQIHKQLILSGFGFYAGMKTIKNSLKVCFSRMGADNSIVSKPVFDLNIPNTYFHTNPIKPTFAPL